MPTGRTHSPISGGPISGSTGLGVTCVRVREALSARADGEETGIADRLVESHVALCDACGAFRAHLLPLGRRIGVRVLSQAPDLSTRILATLGCQERYGTFRGALARSCAYLGRRRWVSASRWLTAAVPLVVALASLNSGGIAGNHGSPSRAVTPCTAALHRTHRPPG